MEGEDTSAHPNATQDQDVEMKVEEGKVQQAYRPEETFFVPLDVLLMVKTSQNQNGLRNNDYYRYYKYCSRKIHRLRKATKFTQGRKKFVKNEIDAAKVRLNQRAVQIPLFSAERDWAQAMFLKKQLTEHGDEFMRNKHTARKKLKRAHAHAKEFFEIVEEVFDKQTTVEAEAYLSSIKASLDIEYARYEDALDALLRTRIIYKNLAKSKDSLEAAIYNEKQDQIEPLIRLCTYNLQSQTGENMSNLEELEQKYNQREHVDTKVSNSITGTRRESIENITNITYQGKSIPLKTQKLKHCFQKLEGQLHNMEGLKDSRDLSLKEKIDNYTHLLHTIEDCVVIIQKEKAEETKKSEASGTLYNLLLAYVSKIKNTSILERCLLKAFAYAENIPLAQLFTKQKLRAAQRPQIVMKLFDKALKALKTISQDRGSMDQAKILEFNQREMIIQVYLKFYIAVHYANEKRYQHAYVILKRAREDVERCNQYSKNIAKNEELTKLQEFNENQIEYMLCKTQAVLMIEQQKRVDSVSKDLSHMDLNERTKKDADDTLNIVEWLFDNQGNLKEGQSSGSDYKIELTEGNMDILQTGGKNVLFVDEESDNPMDLLLNKKVRLNKKAKLVELFPKMQPVMPKPFFFDIAADAIEYPNIAQTIKELQGKDTPSGGGLLGKLKGAFWG
jgi:hypothetical protein